MKKGLLSYLYCPHCNGELHLDKHIDEPEILAGSLLCGTCQQQYEITDGVPIFTKFYKDHKIKLTAQNFGYSWQKFSKINKGFYKKQFFDWIKPVNENFLKGKVVLDAGCGKGRHLMTISPYVKEVIGVDISDSVFVAYNNTKHLPNVHIIQADLNYLPLKDEIFDYVYSIGVVHHTESPKTTIYNLHKKTKKSGSISLWIYGKENNEWIVYCIDPVRKFLTHYMPPEIIHIISFLLTLLLFPILKIIYLPTVKFKILQPLGKVLFYHAYLSYISEFDFTEINSIICDHLVAPVSHYLSKKEVEDMVSINSSKSNLEWHNKNSWRILIAK